MINILDTCFRIICYFIGRLFGGYRLKPYEKVILKAFSKELPEEAATIFQKQMALFNYIWHSFGRQDSIFLYLGLGFKDLPDSVKLSYRNIGEIPIFCAKIHNKARNDLPAGRVDLLIWNGMFKALYFNIRPKRILGRKYKSLNEFIISDIKLLFDPMDPDPFPTKKTNHIGSLPAWVQPLLKSSPVVEMLTPLSEDLRRKIVDYYELEFPPDYLELVSVTEYLDCDDFEIFGLSKIWIYVTPHEYILKLTEIKGHGALCLLRDREPGLYYIDNEDHIPVPVGGSLKEAMCKALNEGVKEWIDREHLYV
jgi:hypothetical protein